MKKLMKVEVKIENVLFRGQVEVSISHRGVYWENWLTPLYLKDENNKYLDYQLIENMEAMPCGKFTIRLKNGITAEGIATFEDSEKTSEYLEESNILDEIFYWF